MKKKYPGMINLIDTVLNGESGGGGGGGTGGGDTQTGPKPSGLPREGADAPPEGPASA